MLTYYKLCTLCKDSQLAATSNTEIKHSDEYTRGMGNRVNKTWEIFAKTIYLDREELKNFGESMEIT